MKVETIMRFICQDPTNSDCDFYKDNKGVCYNLARNIYNHSEIFCCDQLCHKEWCKENDIPEKILDLSL
jgi:hypothetical protein